MADGTILRADVVRPMPAQVTGTTGIDPNLAWDEDGTCHLAWRGYGMADATVGGGIKHVTIAPLTGERPGEATDGLARPALTRDDAGRLSFTAPDDGTAPPRSWPCTAATRPGVRR